jgi:hypothetical protein
MSTQNGRHLGGRRSRHDERDHHFAAKMASLLAAEYPRKAALIWRLPLCWHQGPLGSCEAHGCGRLLTAIHGVDFMPARLAMYYQGRLREGTENEDAGVETRDMLKVMQAGVYDEKFWPYDVSRFAEAPPEAEPLYKIGSYSRIVDQDDAVACIANGNPFAFAVALPAYFDDADIASHGVMRRYAEEKIIGEHCMACVGYDLDFKTSIDFANSGLRAEQVDDSMALVANSWGTGWGLSGHCWIPMSWIFDPGTGNDAWAVHPPSSAAEPKPEVAGVPIEGYFVTDKD